MSADTGPCEPSIADVRSLSTEIAALLAESKSNPQHLEDQLKPQSTDTALPQNDFNSNSDAVAWDQRLSKLAQNVRPFFSTTPAIFFSTPTTTHWSFHFHLHVLTLIDFPDRQVSGNSSANWPCSGLHRACPSFHTSSLFRSRVCSSSLPPL